VIVGLFVVSERLDEEVEEAAETGECDADPVEGLVGRRFWF
jgi:hypothetical protein